MDWQIIIKYASGATGVFGLLGIVVALVYRHLDRTANESIVDGIAKTYKVPPNLIAPILAQLNGKDRLKGLMEILHVSGEQARDILNNYKVVAPELKRKRQHQIKVGLIVAVLAFVFGVAGVAISYAQRPQTNPDPIINPAQLHDDKKPQPEPKPVPDTIPDPVPKPIVTPVVYVEKTIQVHLASVSSTHDEGPKEINDIWYPPTGCKIISFEKLEPFVELDGNRGALGGGSDCCPCGVLVERDGDGLRYQIKGKHGSWTQKGRCLVHLKANVTLSCPQ